MTKFRNDRRSKTGKPRPHRGESHPRRDKGASVLDSREGYFVMGRNAVREVLRSQPQRVQKVYIATSGGDHEIDALIERNHFKSEFVAPESLTALLGSGSHQSYAAQLREKSSRDLKDFLTAAKEKPRAVVIALDAIQDPQNLGAILRAAECFGVDAVLWSRNRGAGLTPVVAKTSVGASELVDAILVSNLADALRKLREEGFWVVAADGSPGAQSIESFEFPDKTALVFGSEGEGIQRVVLENADFRVAIPMQGQIDSLNVSQAVAVFLYASRKKG